MKPAKSEKMLKGQKDIPLLGLSICTHKALLYRCANQLNAKIKFFFFYELSQNFFQTVKDLESRPDGTCNKLEMFLPIARKSSWSQACSWAKGPLYSSSPSAMSVMNSSDTRLSKQGIMGGNQAQPLPWKLCLFCWHSGPSN